jgi:hypothetical protein
MRVGRRTGLVTVAAIVLGLGVGVAHAVSEWWTPTNGRCPAFDTDQACQAYCNADPSRCGGATQCTFRTGPTRPDCAVRAPDGGRGGDGWVGPGAR